MRTLKAKLLRVTARTERANEKDVVDRELLEKKSGQVVENPYSVRALYLQLKKRYLALLRSLATPAKFIKDRYRPPSKAAPNPQAQRIATIERPLHLIARHCPPTENVRGEMEVHPIYQSARYAAKAGRGDLVQLMARQFLRA